MILEMVKIMLNMDLNPLAVLKPFLIFGKGSGAGKGNVEIQTYCVYTILL